MLLYANQDAQTLLKRRHFPIHRPEASRALVGGQAAAKGHSVAHGGLSTVISCATRLRKIVVARPARLEQQILPLVVLSACELKRQTARPCGFTAVRRSHQFERVRCSAASTKKLTTY